MNRFKFRAWNIDAKFMVVDCHNRRDFHEYLEDPNMIIMQWTGLYDCKGKEIYEGDILFRRSFSSWVVKWYKAGFYIYNTCNPQQMFVLDGVSEREILGNIYENEKELLT